MASILLRSALILVLALGASGCMVVGATVGTAVGVTAKAATTTAKVGGKAVVAAGKAVIPGDSEDDED